MRYSTVVVVDFVKTDEKLLKRVVLQKLVAEHHGQEAPRSCWA
jgi:hypothetical protein